MARKTRITLLTIWSLIILVVFFTHHRSNVAAQKQVSTSDTAVKGTSDRQPAQNIEVQVPGFVSGDGTEKVLGVDKSGDPKGIPKPKVIDEKTVKPNAQKQSSQDDKTATKTVAKASSSATAVPTASSKAAVASSKPLSNKQTSSDKFDPAKAYAEALDSSPVVIFSKTYCPYSKAAKQLLLQKYKITPAPIVIELDTHPHGKEFQEYIGLQTDRTTVPNILVNRVSRGGADNFVALDKSNTLIKQMTFWSYNTFTIELAPTTK